MKFKIRKNINEGIASINDFIRSINAATTEKEMQILLDRFSTIPANYKVSREDNKKFMTAWSNKIKEIRKNVSESLSNKDKQIYIRELNKAEDKEDLEDIIHEIFFYDKSLFAKLRKLPKDEPFEASKERLVKIINDSMKESLNEASEQDNFKLYIFLNTATRERRPLQSEDLEDFIEEECSTEEEFFEAIEDLDVVDLEDIRTEKELIDWLEGQDYSFGDPIIYKVIFKGATIYDDSDYFESIKTDLESDDYDEESSWDESLDEDTIKQGNKWVNKGKEGTHGEFKTKKEADAQRRAIWVNWNK